MTSLLCNSRKINQLEKIESLEELYEMENSIRNLNITSEHKKVIFFFFCIINQLFQFSYQEELKVGKREKLPAFAKFRGLNFGKRIWL